MKNTNKIIDQIIKTNDIQSILEVIGDGISIQDTNFKILYQNKIAKNFVGEHVGEYCYKAYEHNDKTCKGCPLAESFKDGKIHTEVRSAPIGKGIEYFEITTSPIRDSAGKIIAGIEVVRNISERKQIEESLNESEEKYRLLFSAEKDAIIMIDNESRRIVDANDAALHLYGYSKDEMLGLTALALSAEPEKSDAAISEVAASAARHIHLFKRNHKKKNGTIFPVEISSGKFMLRGRKKIVAIVRDVTESRRVAEKLRNSEERHRAVVEDQTELICRWLPGGKLTFVNDAYCRYFSKKRKELIGYSFIPLIPEEYHEKIKKDFASLNRKNPISTHEHRVILSSGEIRWQQWTNRAIFNTQGLLVEFQSVGRDITERKQAEEALQKAHSKMEKRVKERTTELEETNTALKVLLKQLENDKRTFEEHILSNLKHLVLPYIAKLKENRSMSKELSYLNIIEANLNEIVSPFSQKLSSEYFAFTPQELKIANLIKDGNQDKDISEILNISLETVKTHRQ
ncbi:MAG: PAS domain S-box protein, partial [Candidatus Hodarchaeales archaeon]